MSGFMQWRPCKICGLPVGYDHPDGIHYECKEKAMAVRKVSYEVSNMQRQRVFAHVLGLVLSVQAVEDFAPDNRVKNGVDAMEVFFGYAQQYSYEDVVRVFEALPGDALGKSDAYQDFIQFYKQVMGEEDEDESPDAIISGPMVGGPMAGWNQRTQTWDNAYEENPYRD